MNIEDVLNNINYYVQNYTVVYDNQYSNTILWNLATTYEAKGGKIFDLNILALAVAEGLDSLYTVNITDFPSDTIVSIVQP
jgi:hypothetical protein